MQTDSYSAFCSILEQGLTLTGTSTPSSPLFGILHILVFTSNRYRLMKLSKVHDEIGTCKCGESPRYPALRVDKTKEAESSINCALILQITAMHR